MTRPAEKYIKYSYKVMISSMVCFPVVLFAEVFLQRFNKEGGSGHNMTLNIN